MKWEVSGAPLDPPVSLIILCVTCVPEAAPASAFLAAPKVGAMGKQLILTWGFRLELQLLLFTLLEIVMWVQS